MSRRHHKSKGVNKMRVHWETVSTIGSLAPSGREGHSADVVNGSVFTFGGLENGSRVSKLLRFNLADHRWSTQSDLAAAVATPAENPELTTVDLDVLDATSTADHQPAPRCYHDSWVVGHRLLCFGGEGSTSSPAAPRDGFKQSDVFDDPATQRRTRRVCFDDVSVYDSWTHKWEIVKSGLAPLPRKGHSCTMVGGGVDGHVVVFGGEPSGKGAPMNDTHCVTVGSLLEGVAMWEKQRPLGDTPSPRHGHTAVALVDSPHQHGRDRHDQHEEWTTEPDQSYLVVFGGTGGGGLLFNDVYTFGLVTKEWESMSCEGHLPAPRYGHTACMVPKRVRGGPKSGARDPLMIVFGGVTRTGSELTFCRDLQILNMTTRTWSETRTTHLYPSPRYGHAMVVLESATAAEFEAELVEEGKKKKKNPYTSSGHVHVAKLLVFGGLNQRYCSNEIWSAEIQMMRDGRETWGDGFDDEGGEGMALAASSPSKKRGRSSVSGEEFELVNRELMKERKLKILAEERLIAVRKEKQNGLAEIERLKAKVIRVEEDMVRTRKEANEKVERVRVSGEEDRKQLDALRQELDESRRLLSLMDLSGQMRTKVWQQKAKDAEEKLEKMTSSLTMT